MDMHRLGVGIAPLASLFLALSLYAFLAGAPRPVGIRVPTLKLRQHSPGYACEDDRWLVVWLRDGGKVQINETPIDREQLAAKIKLIFENRIGRVAYLLADPEVSFAEAAWAIDRIESALPGMHVILLTPEFKKLTMLPPLRVDAKPHDYVPSCDWEWAENGFDAPSIQDKNDQLYYLKYLNAPEGH